MKLFGLLGKTLSHSFSKKYFTEKFLALNLSDHKFELFEIHTIEDLPKLWSEKMPLAGMNVTIPYKEQIIPYLDKLDDSAKEIGAVNVVKFTKDGQKIGFNSDYYGFRNSLLNTLKLNQLPIPKAALILGTGGASKAVLVALKHLNIDYKMVSRSKSKADFDYEDLRKIDFNQYTLIINASPLGTYPNVDECPDIPYQDLTNQHLLFDLVYNPEETLFMKKGLDNGAAAKNGLEMLHLQAEKAWEIWNS